MGEKSLPLPLGREGLSSLFGKQEIIMALLGGE